MKRNSAKRTQLTTKEYAGGYSCNKLSGCAVRALPDKEINAARYSVLWSPPRRITEQRIRIVNVPIKLNLKVVPGASRDEIVGWLGNSLKIRVRAQPEKGRANAAVLALLAAELDLPARDLIIYSGHSSNIKGVEISEISHAEFRSRLGQLPA